MLVNVIRYARLILNEYNGSLNLFKLYKTTKVSVFFIQKGQVPISTQITSVTVGDILMNTRPLLYT